MKKLILLTPVRLFLAVLATVLCTAPALVAEAAPTLDQRVAALEAYVSNGDPGKALTGIPGPGHNAWMMTSSALVLFMTLPGLALFYGGLVRRKNVLSVLAQCLGIAGLVTILWWTFGYSLVFGTSFKGSFAGRFLRWIGTLLFPWGDLGAQHRLRLLGIPDVFAIYQLMFAIITPALIIGAIASG